MSTDDKHQVRIHVDRTPYEAPNPITGSALYALAQIGNHRDLYREVDGDHEDQEIPRDDHEIHLNEDEHFYSQKEVIIIVNGEQKETSETRLSFDEVVKLAFPVPPIGQNIKFTITYRKGPNANPKGSLTEGHSVKIKKGMIFDVTPTDRS